MNEQNFANHVKFVPPFHFFAVPVFVINFFFGRFTGCGNWVFLSREFSA